MRQHAVVGCPWRLRTQSLSRTVLGLVVLSLTFLGPAAAAEIDGARPVEVQAPQRGSAPDVVVVGYGMAMRSSQNDEISVTIGVDPPDIEKVTPDAAVHLESLLPGRKPIEGRVQQIGRTVDRKTRLVSVVIAASGSIQPGENFRAGIVAGTLQGWVVPRESIGYNSKGAFVFQVVQERAKRVQVKIIKSLESVSLVEGDIDPQQPIILRTRDQVLDGSAIYQITDGSAVKPQEGP